MRVFFLGKGGSGKTSLAAAFTRFALSKYASVVAIDADVNEHFAAALGVGDPAVTIGESFSDIHRYLFETRKASNVPMLGSVPPSNDSRFVYIHERSPLLKRLARREGNLYFLKSGKYQSDEVGVTCFHGKIYPTELLLHYLIDRKNELVVVDSNAGIDGVSTTMHFAGDIYFFVVEPTQKSIDVYKQYRKLVDEAGSTVKVIINKVRGPDDVSFVLKSIAEGDVAAIIDHSSDLKRFEQGDAQAMDLFINKNRVPLEKILETVQSVVPNKARYYTNLVNTFKKQSQGFLSQYYDFDSTAYLDPEFSYDSLSGLSMEEYFKTCYLTELSAYKSEALLHLHQHVRGKVLELGAGTFSWYWALAYYRNVESVLFTDYYAEAVDFLSDFIAQTDSSSLASKISDTLVFLRENGCLPHQWQLSDLFVWLNAHATFSSLDFLSMRGGGEGEFDTIVGMEVLEVVNDEEEFRRGLQFVYDHLRAGGKFVGSTFIYSEMHPRVNNLRGLILEGDYNPGEKEFRRIAQEVGFTSVEIIKRDIGVQPYREALFLVLTK